MKVQKSFIENKEVTQIFLNKEESDKIENQQKIERLKNENKNVVLFLAGYKSTADSIKYMLQSIKNKTELN